MFRIEIRPGDRQMVVHGIGQQDRALGAAERCVPVISRRVVGEVDRHTLSGACLEHGHPPAPGRRQRMGDRPERPGDFAQDVQGDRHVVRREHPEGGGFALGTAPLQALEGQAHRLAQFARARDLRHRLDAGVVAPFVHHEDQVAGGGGEGARARDVDVERLLHEHGPAARQ